MNRIRPRDHAADLRPVRGSGVSGSIYYHMLPYLEQSALYNMGPDAARSHPLKVLQHPADPTMVDGGVFDLPVAAPAWNASSGTANPYPAWASQLNTKWGLSSYSANWQVFGDQGGEDLEVRDGLSNTIIFNEKYAVAKRPSGNPMFGDLWGYGVDPRTIPNDFPRAWGGPVPRRRAVGQRPQPGLPLRQRLLAADGFRQSRRPGADLVDRLRSVDVPLHVATRVRPPVNNVHCLKSQSISSGIHAAFADGSALHLERCVRPRPGRPARPRQRRGDRRVSRHSRGHRESHGATMSPFA